MTKYAGMNVPGDFDTEMAAIERQRAVIKALGTGAAPQGQMISGHYVAPNIMQQFAPVLQQLAGQYANSKLDAQASEAQGKYNTGLGQAVQQYMDTRGGKEEMMPQQGPPVPAADGGLGEALPDQMTRTMAADPRKAVVEAMASQYAPIRAIGAADMAAMGKGAMTPKEIFDRTDATMASRIAAAQAGNPALLVPVGKSHVIGERLVHEGETGETATRGDYRQGYEAPGQIGTGPDGKPIYGQLAKETGKATFLPGGTTVNVDTGKKGSEAFAVEGAKDLVTRLKEGQVEAKKATQSLSAFSNAATHLNNLKGGAGADLIMTAKKVFAQFGVDDPSITSMEQIRSALQQAVLDNSKSLGTGNGFTDNDRKFLQDIVYGNISLDPATLKRAVDMGIANNMNTLYGHDRFVQESRGNKFADPGLVDSYKVALPKDWHLDGDRFGIDESSGRFYAKTSSGDLPSPINQQDASRAPAAPTRGVPAWNAQKESRMQELERQLGGGR